MLRRIGLRIRLLPSNRKFLPNSILEAYQNDFYHSQISSKYTSIRELSQSTSTSTTEVKEEAVENEKPITFTKSKAFKAKPTFINPRHEESRPRFQDLSILVSLSSFMLWFFVLREENDLDVEIGRSLYDRIDGLEKANILTSIRYHDQNGLDATALRKRLEEIVAEEDRAKREYSEKEEELKKLYVKS